MRRGFAQGITSILVAYIGPEKDALIRFLCGILPFHPLLLLHFLQVLVLDLIQVKAVQIKIEYRLRWKMTRRLFFTVVVEVNAGILQKAGNHTVIELLQMSKPDLKAKGTGSIRHGVKGSHRGKLLFGDTGEAIGVQNITMGTAAGKQNRNQTPHTDTGKYAFRILHPLRFQKEPKGTVTDRNAAVFNLIGLIAVFAVFSLPRIIEII